jgi:hypothetical protein
LGFLGSAEVRAAEPVVTGHAASPTVALVLPPGKPRRIVEDLRSELEASRFAVLSIPAAHEPSTTRTYAEGILSASSGAPSASATHLPAAIAVLVVGDGGIVIYTLARGPDGGLNESQLTGPLADRPSRRRLCLAVVERLRQIEESTAAERRATPAAPVPPAKSNEATEAQTPKPLVPLAETAPPPPSVYMPARPPWWFGATSDLNLLSARGTPTAHISLIAERPFSAEGPLSLSVRAAWPVLGAQLTDEAGRFIRTWTFSGEVGVRLRLWERAARLRPVLGVAVGIRSALTDTGEFEMRASRLVMLPAVSYAANAGLRFRLRPLVDLVFESDLSQAQLPFDGGRSYERAAAEEWLLRFSLGVMFEY